MLFPPLGILLVWLEFGRGMTFRLVNTLWAACYGLVYLVIVGVALHQAGMLELEWRGGSLPTPTFDSAGPDYEAIDQHRAENSGSSGQIATVYTNALWSGFRGPDRTGVYTERAINVDWSGDGLPLKWRQPCGGGYASFAIAQGMAFTIEQRRMEEVVSAYDLETGREVWTQAYDAWFQEAMGGDGPRATPTWHDGRLYSMGALGDLLCLETTTGEVVWRKQTMFAAGNMKITQAVPWGVATSPLVVDTNIVVLPGGMPGASVVALSLETGDHVWGDFDDRQSYMSPMLVELAGRRQILVTSADRAMGIDAASKELLWEFPWSVAYDVSASQPVVIGGDRVFLSAGYGVGCAMIGIEADEEGRFSVTELWRNKRLKNKFSSSVHHDGFIYGLDESILTCLDAETGERMWKDGRYGHGQLILADGYLIVLSVDGELALVKAVPDRFEEVARFQAIEGKTWNHPAIAGGYLLVRNAQEMACFDISAD